MPSPEGIFLGISAAGCLQVEKVGCALTEEPKNSSLVVVIT